MFSSLLIANRGEIARRIIRTARRMGIRTVAVLTEADRSWPHWREADTHEGRDPAAERTFREIARLTGGAYLPFNSASARELRSLLNAVATYAAGGLKALERSKGAGAQLLLPQLKR